MSESVPAADLHLLQRLERAFATHAGGDAAIDAAELQRALGLRSGYLARRVLALLDANGDGVVRRDEFLEGVRRLVFGSAQEKLAFAFRMHDHNGDGVIERDEMHRMVAMALVEDDVPTRVSHIDHLVDTLFHHADRNRDGKISLEEFETAVCRRPALLAQMTRSEARWIAPDEDLLAHALAPPRPLSLRLRRALENRRVPSLFVALWVLGTVGCLVAGALSVYGRGTPRSEAFWMLSRGCTTAIQFNAALIVLPVLRRTLTWLRGTRLSRALPIDEAVDFHRSIGNTLYALTVGHVFAAVADDAASGDVLARLGSPQSLSGLGWFVVFTLLWSFSRNAVRRSGSFELFYFSHLLYVVWFAFALLHAGSVFAASAASLVVLGAELVSRKARRGRRVRVRSLTALPSGVTRVELERPAGFEHRAGDWVFLRVPALARHEWHPFTVSSAPERDTLTLHVRSLGNWSAALRRLADDPAALEGAGAREVFVDGPYGSPAGHIFAAACPVLIGAGIGVTPFASVLDSLVWRQRSGTTPPSMRHAYFFWLNRDLYSFDWFRQLLLDLEQQDARKLLDAQIWLTGGRVGASAMGLELARELVHEAGGHDLVSGMRTRMRMEHPDWDAELSAIQRAHAPLKPEIFFCGPPGLGRKIEAVCDRLGLPFRQERF